MNINFFYVLSMIIAMSLQQGCVPSYNASQSSQEERHLRNKIDALNLAIRQARLEKNLARLRTLSREKETYLVKIRSIRQYQSQSETSKNFDFIPSYQAPYSYSTQNTRAQIQADATLAHRLQVEELRRADQQQRRQDALQHAQMQTDETLARRLQTEERWRAEQEQHRRQNDDARNAQIKADEALARRLQAEEIRRAQQQESQEDARRAQIQADEAMARRLQEEERQAQQRTQSDAQKAQIEADHALAEQLQREENQKSL